MQFFLYEILARIVAAYLFIDSARELRAGLVERKIDIFNPDWLDWLLNLSPREVQRDTSPFWYWSQIVIHAFVMVCCLVVAIFGWFHPETAPSPSQ